MSHTEIWLQPVNKFRSALIVAAALVGLYFYLGYLPFIFWVIGGVFAIALVWSLIHKPEPGPVIILDETGLLDKRLKVGAIQWSDIRRIESHSISGANFISLELHNLREYESRRPLWLRVLAQSQRILRMTPIAIATNHLDVDHNTLVQMIHEGCGGSARETQNIA
jgi:hypothetical protein